MSIKIFAATFLAFSIGQAFAQSNIQQINCEDQKNYFICNLGNNGAISNIEAETTKQTGQISGATTQSEPKSNSNEALIRQLRVASSMTMTVTAQQCWLDWISYGGNVASTTPGGWTPPYQTNGTSAPKASPKFEGELFDTGGYSRLTGPSANQYYENIQSFYYVATRYCQ